MTKQEIFDKALFGVREQGKPSMEDGLCVYKNKDGCKCPIGHLMTDKTYDKKFEEKTLVKGGVVKTWFIQEFGNDNLALGISMQYAHDKSCDYSMMTRTTAHNNVFMSKFEQAMKVISIEYSLKYVPPKERLPKEV